MGNTKELQKVLVAQLDELPLKIGKEVKVGGHEIALFRLSNGKVKAIENKCPHKQGPLAEGIVSGEHVFCPLHDWKIDITTGEVQKPDDGCVKTYDVEVTDDTVYILL
ncbi:nitrite reductase small subunit NirD [Evansella cellulosilytica]|uniref:Nitrite reductase (NAD(P)H), small subunit n=1 Tax=Evansella cellulosilytica (strain ATCC 21833 / DSM 2522 / FERM P-1141 / JCM 9156 / N-4) TaxID=649639 RepID=E6U1A2_EVAC2|nr:nitrite reductase small subunit NirD [Evansella cellulosilytica]ADU29149.1 nitrite reductase (NAD(P)H), small subunit [Evansella cellulosilytica DSM 2522]